MTCGPFTSFDAGYYDPRGSGADYETLKCEKCGKMTDFRVNYRDDFYERFEKTCAYMKKVCDNPKSTTQYHKDLLIDMFSLE